MAYYENKDWDELFYKMEDFLKKYKIADLLFIMHEAVDDAENGFPELEETDME